MPTCAAAQRAHGNPSPLSGKQVLLGPQLAGARPEPCENSHLRCWPSVWRTQISFQGAHWQL